MRRGPLEGKGGVLPGKPIIAIAAGGDILSVRTEASRGTMGCVLRFKCAARWDARKPVPSPIVAHRRGSVSSPRAEATVSRRRFAAPRFAFRRAYKYRSTRTPEIKTRVKKRDVAWSGTASVLAVLGVRASPRGVAWGGVPLPDRSGRGDRGQAGVRDVCSAARCRTEGTQNGPRPLDRVK